MRLDTNLPRISISKDIQNIIPIINARGLRLGKRKLVHFLNKLQEAITYSPQNETKSEL